MTIQTAEVILRTRTRPRIRVPYRVTRVARGYTATVPVFPAVQASGRTLFEVERTIAEAIARFLK